MFLYASELVISKSDLTDEEQNNIQKIKSDYKLLKILSIVLLILIILNIPSNICYFIIIYKLFDYVCKYHNISEIYIFVIIIITFLYIIFMALFIAHISILIRNRTNNRYIILIDDRNNIMKNIINSLIILIVSIVLYNIVVSIIIYYFGLNYIKFKIIDDDEETKDNISHYYNSMILSFAIFWIISIVCLNINYISYNIYTNYIKDNAHYKNGNAYKFDNDNNMYWYNYITQQEFKLIIN